MRQVIYERVAVLTIERLVVMSGEQLEETQRLLPMPDGQESGIRCQESADKKRDIAHKPARVTRKPRGARKSREQAIPSTEHEQA